MWAISFCPAENLADGCAPAVAMSLQHSGQAWIVAPLPGCGFAVDPGNGWARGESPVNAELLLPSVSSTLCRAVSTTGAACRARRPMRRTPRRCLERFSGSRKSTAAKCRPCQGVRTDRKRRNFWLLVSGALLQHHPVGRGVLQVRHGDSVGRPVGDAKIGCIHRRRGLGRRARLPDLGEQIAGLHPRKPHGCAEAPAERASGGGGWGDHGSRNFPGKLARKTKRSTSGISPHGRESRALRFFGPRPSTRIERAIRSALREPRSIGQLLI
jgi:hypothetical protein